MFTIPHFAVQVFGQLSTCHDWIPVPPRYGATESAQRHGCTEAKSYLVTVRHKVMHADGTWAWGYLQEIACARHVWRESSRFPGNQWFMVFPIEVPVT